MERRRLADETRHRARPHRGWYQPRDLPHFDSPERVQAVTFRLADSLPQSVLDRLAGSPATEMRRRIAACLDAGYGSCLLAEPAHAETVATALTHFDRVRYRLFAWVVMPNHVHALVQPFGGFPIAEIIGGWKSWSAKRINRARGRGGTVWQKDYFDRFIRNERHFFAALNYIEENPVAAGLVTRAEDWRFGSAGFREAVGEGERDGGG
ncbi:MAG: transposase [Alphaproteobacteria bacterium]|nr:transposase [Alphaproteobacteria bacterium]